MTEDGFLQKRRAGIIFAGIVIVAFALRLWAVYSCRFIGMDGGVDGVALLTAARNLFAGLGFSFQGRPETVHAPLFSIFAGGLWRLTGDLELAGLLVSALSGALAAPAVYLLARELYNRSAALFAASLTAVFPPFIFAATEVRVASLYALLYLLTAVFIYRSALKPGFISGLLAGAAIATAYLARPEAVLFLPLGAALFAMRAGRAWPKKAARIASAGGGMALAFVIIAFPYARFLHRHLDVWTLSARAPFTFIPYFADDWEKSNFEVYAYPDRAREEWVARGGMGWVLREHGSEMGRRFAGNLGALFTLGRSYEVSALKLPPLAVSLASSLFVLGLLVMLAVKIWRGRWSFRDSYILVMCLPLAPYFFLTDFLTSQKLRYGYPYLHWALIVAAYYFTARPGRTRRRAAGTVLLAACLAVSVYLIPRKIGLVPYEYKLMGNWMRENLAEAGRSTVMSQRLGVVFYAGARHVQIYPGSWREVLEYARESGAGYLMVDDWTTPRLRPALDFLLTETEPPPELEKVHAVSHRGRRALLYRFQLDENKTGD